MPKAAVSSKATNAKRKTKGKQLCTCSQCIQLNPEGVLVDKASFEKHKNRDMDAAIWHDVNGPVPSSSHGRLSLPSQAGPTLRAASPPSQSSDAAHGAIDSMSEDGDARYSDMIVNPAVDVLDADSLVLLSIDRRTTLVEVPEPPRQYVGACLPDWVQADCLSLDEPLVNPDARFPGPPDDAACMDSVPNPIVIDNDARPNASGAQDAPDLRDEASTAAPSAETLGTPQSHVSDTIESDPPASTTQPPDYLEHPELLKLPHDPPRPYPLPPAPSPPQAQKPGATAERYMSLHNQWYIRVFAALCAVMHIQYHVPQLALDLLLFTVHAVFSALHLLPAVPGEPQMNKFTSCRTAISRLGLDDMFTIYPVCPNCCHVAPPSAPDDYICPECSTALYTHRSKLAKLRGAKRIPVKQWAYTPLSHVLSVILSDDDIQEKIEKQMHSVSTEGHYRNTHDGKIMRKLRGPDGKLFFAKRSNNDSELRIGVTAGVDAFDPFSHSYRDSHSTTAVTWAFCGLDFAERYKHLLLNTLFPGPKEPNCAQLQKYFYLIVNDLLDLYDNGLVVYSKKYPEGRLVRVALIALICDHPAMCKLCGFSDKRHNMAPCTKCKVTQAEIRTARGVRQVFTPRDGAEHKRRALEWLELSGKERDTHYEKYGSQWFELARLPYFDPIRMTVIDPMHCLLLGIVKNLWYNVWIKGTKALRPNTDSGTKRELDILHNMLHEFEQPAWLGRLPKMVGEPAGGSLSADELKHIATTFGPVALPAIWFDTQDAANQEHAKALARYETAVRKQTAAKADFVAQLHARDAEPPLLPDDANVTSSKPKRGKKVAALPQPQTEDEWVEQNPAPQLPVQLRRHQDEMPMFLSLSAALRVLFSRSLTDADVKRGDELLLEHLRRFCELYGDEYLMYNQHWATHIPAQIPDYGPTYGFWAFPGERVNKVLKGVNTNNRRGGEMEITMLRGYQRMTQLSQLLAHAELASTNDTEKRILQRLRTDAQDKRQVRGTVDSIANSMKHSVPGAVSILSDHDASPHVNEVGDREQADETPDRTELIEQEGTARRAGLLVLGPPAKPARLKGKTQSQLLKFYSASGVKIHTASDSRVHDVDSIELKQFSAHHPYITLDGHRIVPVEEAKGSASSALVKVRRAPDDSNIQPCHGEVLNIFSHSLNGIQRTFVTLRAFKDYTPGLMPARWGWWEAYPEVDVEYWYIDQYQETKVVPVENIVCQLARARFDNPPMWMTVALEKHRIDDSSGSGFAVLGDPP